ncbi:ABC transporter permease [Hyalangium rubrum]|uniref:ABC transporter permease n=1 Tax=Hyalangium rubrum TaxID=3103134 RepID=A0ABU5GYM1_9BACT|nr:ABC transporter permease [Hyalangium sp. s54d21]MDY7225642.1 ABC transporter permease [Hyalangium sp. s54d21]
MLIGEIILVAFDAVVANKLRSLLTMLGIVIGIAAVITMVALGEGAQRSVEARLSTLGANVLTVRPGQSFAGGLGRGQAMLSVEDAEALRQAPQYIRAVSPEMETRVQIEHGTSNANLSVVGAWPSYFTVNNNQIANGRLFTEAEDRGRRRVAVLGALVGAQLGGVTSESLVGQTLRIGGVPFEVIGVLAEKGSQGFSNPDESLYIPLSTAQFRVMGSDRVRSIAVQATGEADMGNAMVEIDQILRREHRLRSGEAADFNIRDQASLLSTVQETTQTFTLLLAGIAAISLLVGGIGIMNIMLVSVTERTREIGLRKALGARPNDILFQFLIESLVLCMAGGGLGLLLGLGGSYALQRLAGWQTAVSPEAVMLAFAFSACVGVFFGLWPARRAASLAPIESLRYE